MPDFHDFPDNSELLFGRKHDLAFLLDRAATCGITAIFGQPQMGKTWLLEALGRQLSLQPHTQQTLQLDQPNGYLVGYHEALGEPQEVVIQRAVLDLYARWLADSTYRQQAHVAFLKKKDTLLGDVAQACGRIFLAAANPLTRPIATVVKEALDTLAALNQDIKAGSTLPRLQIDQVRLLLDIVHQVSGLHAILIFDQWERSTAIASESSLFDTFIRHRDQWPPCHFFVGLRREDPAFDKVQALSQAHPHACHAREILPLQLDPDEEIDLLAHLRERVPATSEISTDSLRVLVSGNPAVIDRWRNQPASLRAKLIDLARQAKKYQYPELAAILPQLSYDHFQLALRIAFTPLASQTGSWTTLRTVILGDQTDKDLYDLRQKGLLEQSNPPSLRHQTQWEALRATFLAEPTECTPHLEELALRLAERIRTIDAQDQLFSLALAELESLTSDLPRSPIVAAVFHACRSLLREPYDPTTLLGITSRKGDAALRPRPAILLAVGFYNALSVAKRQNNLPLRDQLLQELRILAQDHPDEPSIREPLAMGLYNTLNAAKEENNLSRRDQLLQELRIIAETHPDDPAVREQLAMGLVNTLNYARQQNDLQRRDQLLEELLILIQSHPDEPIMQEIARRLGLNSPDNADNE